ncbi:MAG: SRPBCC domain-containing protein [Planctomycetota bacterium]
MHASTEPVRHGLTVSDLTLRIEKRIEIDAPLEVAFEAVLREMGPDSTDEDGDPMPLVLEPFPGGRWYRDTGNGTGHLWGHVQVIKPPRALELVGPMFMSYPVASHVRLAVEEGESGCVVTMLHTALGLITDDHREGMDHGWSYTMTRIKEIAEGG